MASPFSRTMKKVNIAILGHRFMGKAHSNAWTRAPQFFDLPCEPCLKVVCGRDADALKAFADRWGWEEVETDWRKLIERCIKHEFAEWDRIQDAARKSA